MPQKGDEISVELNFYFFPMLCFHQMLLENPDSSLHIFAGPLFPWSHAFRFVLNFLKTSNTCSGLPSVLKQNNLEWAEEHCQNINIV